VALYVALYAVLLWSGAGTQAFGWLMIGVGALGFWLYGSAAWKATELIRWAMMPAVARQLDQNYRRAPTPAALGPFATLSVPLLHRIERYWRLDGLSGSWRGCDYQMLSLYERRAPSRTVFSYALLWFPADLGPGEVLVRRRLPRWMRPLAAPAMHTSLPDPPGLDPGFAARFQVLGPDRDRAADLLQPRTQQVILAIDSMHRDGAIAAAVADGRFALLLPLAHRPFHFGGPFRRPSSLRKDLDRALFAAALPRRVIDLFDGERPQRLT